MTDPTAGDLPDRTSRGDTTGMSAANRAREDLAMALSAACRHRPNADDATEQLDRLRGATYTFVATLRAESATIEQAVITTKQLVAATIGTPPSSPEDRALAEQVVRWGIDAYYDSAPRAD